MYWCNSSSPKKLKNPPKNPPSGDLIGRNKGYECSGPGVVVLGGGTVAISLQENNKA